MSVCDTAVDLQQCVGLVRRVARLPNNTLSALSFTSLWNIHLQIKLTHIPQL